MPLRVVAGFISIAFLGVAITLGRVLDSTEARRRKQGDALVYLPPASVARYLALGHEESLADYFWMQALQYYAEPDHKIVFYRDLHRFLDLVVAVDANFRFAYRFAAVTIPYNSGSWTWHNVERSNRIIERGLERFPNDEQLWLQLGFNRGVIGTDYEGAAEAYRRAALASGQHWMAELAARLYATSGALDRARAYSREVLERTTDPDLRDAMVRRVAEIEIEETLLEIDQAIHRYRAETGQDPDAVSVLLAGGYLSRIPTDPLGGDYYIEQGEARSSSLPRGRLRAYSEQAKR